MTVLTDAMIEAYRARRTAGESVKAMAAEVGMPWQTLNTLLRAGRLKTARATRHTRRPQQKAPEADNAASRRDSRPLPWTEKYRPRRLADLRGQGEVVAFLRRFAEAPYPVAFVFEGETGTGKTSAALALAAELGCDVDSQEFGGVRAIASGEQTADTVRETCRWLWTKPFAGSGWKVLVVNEADRMNPAVETIWLDRLECLPERSVVIFTTNHPDKLSRRLRDRCVRLGFVSEPEKVKVDAYALLASICRREGLTQPDMALIHRVVQEAVEDGAFSFRRAVQRLAVLMQTQGPIH